MKKYITAPVLAEMIILSTFIADCLPTREDVKQRKKQARNRVEVARHDILSRVQNGNDKDGQIYDATDFFFDKYYLRFQKSEIINICRKALNSYLNMYAFGDSFYNLFKKLHKNSEPFEVKNFDIPEYEKISFMIELKKITQTAEMQVN